MWRRVNVSFAEDPIPKFPTKEDKEREKAKKKLKDLKVLFVSRRDTCRGPMAECIFDHINEKFAFKPFARFFYRSCSAGMIRYNGGHLPDQLALRVLAENNLQTSHGSRQILSSDFTRYDYILYMEPWQGEELNRIAPKDKKAKIYMLGDFMKGRNKIIEDPFDEDLNSFRYCFERIYIACEDFYFHINERRLC